MSNSNVLLVGQNHVLMLHPEIINISPMCSFQEAELSHGDSSAARNYFNSA